MDILHRSRGRRGCRYELCWSSLPRFLPWPEMHPIIVAPRSWSSFKYGRVDTCARRAGGLGNPAQVQREAGVPLCAPPVIPPTLPVVTGYVPYYCCTCTRILHPPNPVSPQLVQQRMRIRGERLSSGCLETIAGNERTPRGAEVREREGANQPQARASDIRAGQQRCTL